MSFSCLPLLVRHGRRRTQANRTCVHAPPLCGRRIIPSPRLYRVAAQAIVAAAPQLSTYMRRKACYSLACLDNRRLNRMAWARKAPQPRPASKQHQAAGRQAVPLAAAADTQQAAPAQAPGRSRPKRQEPAGVVAC